MNRSCVVDQRGCVLKYRGEVGLFFMGWLIVADDTLGGDCVTMAFVGNKASLADRNCYGEGEDLLGNEEGFVAKILIRISK